MFQLRLKFAPAPEIWLLNKIIHRIHRHITYMTIGMSVCNFVLMVDKQNRNIKDPMLREIPFINVL